MQTLDEAHLNPQRTLRRRVPSEIHLRFAAHGELAAAERAFAERGVPLDVRCGAGPGIAQRRSGESLPLLRGPCSMK
ncbi:hypothetical protein A6P39_038670 [Streptomyces sp. FXJ1.172]|uniref:hypothetical protein n=1 Tax=Streptomyces sp. FXJ1.172 TaxID=710705 RepID=UPI0007CF9B8E|nr:hypothetical protein [Streptomyces sp. FXJ1.172]WEO99495.1 hypothetical protein A6P39_038670 [Streptomyces sp. FXJ1.172]